MEYEYFILPKHWQKPVMITQINFELVNLRGEDVKRTIPASRKSPERVVTARAATQADLELLYGDDTPGNWKKIIGRREKVKETVTKVVEAPKGRNKKVEA